MDVILISDNYHVWCTSNLNAASLQNHLTFQKSSKSIKATYTNIEFRPYYEFRISNNPIFWLIYMFLGKPVEGGHPGDKQLISTPRESKI